MMKKLFSRSANHGAKSPFSEQEKKDEKMYKNHPLIKSRAFAMSHDVIDSIPAAHHSPPLERLMAMYEEIKESGEGLSAESKNKKIDVQQLGSPPTIAIAEATPTEPKAQQHLPAIVTVPLKQDTRETPKDYSAPSPADLTPASSLNALDTLQAHSILTNNGYVSFKPPSQAAAMLDPAEPERADPDSTNMSQANNSTLAATVPRNLLKSSNTVPTFQRSTSSILDRVSERELTPSQLQELIQRAIVHHESNRLVAAFQLYCITAQQGLPIGLFLAGLSLRHGWGCVQDQQLGASCLEYAADLAAKSLKKIRNTTNSTTAPSESIQVPAFSSDAASKRNSVTLKLIPEEQLPALDRVHAQILKYELSMSVYELGQCYRFGWGVRKSKVTAVFYFKLAADLGDCDAQLDLANCYLNGIGIKADRFMAASYFRIASLQGKKEYGLSWVYKEKYDVFFHKNFPHYAKMEDKVRGMGADVVEPTSVSQAEKNAGTYLHSIQNYLATTMNSAAAQ